MVQVDRAELSDPIFEPPHTSLFPMSKLYLAFIVQSQMPLCTANMFSATVHFAVTDQWLSSFQKCLGTVVYVLLQSLLVETLLQRTSEIVGMYTGIINHNVQNYSK